MDDGWEMSDGVQAKVPIRGQLEGGVSATGANGRRLEETTTVASAQPRLLNLEYRARAALPLCILCSIGSLFYVCDKQPSCGSRLL